MDAIVVTGSRLQPTGFTTPTPVTVVAAQQMEQRSAGTVFEIIRDIPSFRGTSGPAPTRRGPERLQGQPRPARPRRHAHPGADQRPPPRGRRHRQRVRHQPDPHQPDRPCRHRHRRRLGGLRLGRGGRRGQLRDEEPFRGLPGRPALRHHPARRQPGIQSQHRLRPLVPRRPAARGDRRRHHLQQRRRRDVHARLGQAGARRPDHLGQRHPQPRGAAACRPTSSPTMSRPRPTTPRA